MIRLWLSIGVDARTNNKPHKTMSYDSVSVIIWVLLDAFQTSAGAFQALEDVVLVGSAWMADRT